ncbi:hypothetical protein QCA50_003756 [Cerrena zonata]|uniref:Elongator complex protein 5 n=1 Tax=Cerrena zonata TaxID=2478898 RepID=A0AAW0GHG6_9APHY
MSFPSSGLLSRGELLVLTDEVSSPAEFLIHRILSTHLKEANESKCLFLSVSESLTRLRAIAGKSNLNLPQYIQSGSFHFVDVASQIDPPVKIETSFNQQPSLKPIFELTKQKLSGWSGTESSVLVILDDISTLEWIGYSITDLLRFIRVLSAFCRKANASLLIRHHIVTPSEPDDILRLLRQLCAYHLEVLPLSTGRSGSVSGQVALHPGPGITQPVHRPITRKLAVQYRLTDTNVVFFERGTGNTVL